MVNYTLFKSGNYWDPIAPSEGLNIGEYEYKDSDIKKWISMYCYSNNKACRLSSVSRGDRKQWECTDESCSWSVAVSRGKRNGKKPEW